MPVRIEPSRGLTKEPEKLAEIAVPGQGSRITRLRATAAKRRSVNLQEEKEGRTQRATMQRNLDEKDTRNRPSTTMRKMIKRITPLVKSRRLQLFKLQRKLIRMKSIMTKKMILSKTVLQLRKR